MEIFLYTNKKATYNYWWLTYLNYAAFFSVQPHCGIGKALPFLGKRTFPSITTDRLKIIAHGSPHLGQIPVAIVYSQLISHL